MALGPLKHGRNYIESYLCSFYVCFQYNQRYRALFYFFTYPPSLSLSIREIFNEYYPDVASVRFAALPQSGLGLEQGPPSLMRAILIGN